MKNLEVVHITKDGVSVQRLSWRTTLENMGGSRW